MHFKLILCRKIRNVFFCITITSELFVNFSKLTREMKFSKLYCFIFLLSFANQTNAQINTMAGYVYGYSDITILNTVIDSFNARTPKLSATMGHVNSTHGMVLGLRYRFPHLSLEFSWANSYARVSNRSTAGVTEVKNTLSFTSNNFSLGGELFYGKLGVGGSFDLNTYRIKTAKPGFNPRDDVFTKTGVTNNIFISIELPVNERMSLCFRPYVQLPTTSFDFYNTATHLNTEIETNTGQYQSGIVTYGLKILFFNGKKNYETED